MSSADLMRELLALELSTEQALAVMDIIEARESGRKEKGRERWHRWNEKRLSNVSKREQTLANVSTPTHARVEDSSSKIEISGKGKEEKKTPRAELAAVLDAERADAVLEHRQRLRKPLTSRAAKMLAAELAKAPDPNSAADLMLAKGWAGFEIGWLESRQPRAASPPAIGIMDAYNELEREGFFTDGQASSTSVDGDAQRLPAERGGRQEGAVVDLRPGIVRRLGVGGH